MPLDLIVRANQELVITESLPNLYDRFVMEDNSVIRVRRSTVVNARAATFGRNCLISGSAEPRQAPSGKNARGRPRRAAEGEGGEAGYTGEDGRPGGDGFDITLRIGLSSLESLRLESNGGYGGNGGKGGRGGKGGGARCFPPKLAGTGGAGGNGGDGGRGGNAGLLTFIWSPLDSFVQAVAARTGANPPQIRNEIAASLSGNSEFLPAGLTSQSEGGQGGSGGKRGEGAAGGPGADCGVGAMGGGAKGGWGRRGRDGRDGQDKVLINQQGG